VPTPEGTAGYGVIVAYRQVFAAPGAVATVVAGVASRTGHFMTVLAAVLCVSATTGSYGLAGAVSAGYALAYAAVSPLTSRLVDRLGQRRVLIPAAAGNVGARAAMLAAAWWQAPGWALVALAAAAGASMPAVGSLVRARWSRLYRDSPLLHPALAFESVMDEVILVVGPVTVAMLAGHLHPSAGLLAALLLTAGGLTALAAGAPPAGPTRPAVAMSGTPLLTSSGFIPLLATFALVAAATVTVELGVVAFTQQRDAATTSGWILAALALSSASCGLWYGARRWRRPPQQRLPWTLGLFAASTLGFVAAPNLPTLFAAAALVGLTLAPTFIDGFSIAHSTAPAHRLTEGLTWMTTAAGTGIALGAVVAGPAIDAWGTTITFTLATGCAAAAIPLTLAAGRVTGGGRGH
jgi:MFS family permease